MLWRIALKTARRWTLAIGGATLLTITGPSRGFGDAPAPVAVSFEDFYAALVEPSLTDGQLTDAERQVIVMCAKKMLSEPQVRELQRRLAAIVAKQSGAEAVAVSGATSHVKSAAQETPAPSPAPAGPALVSTDQIAEFYADECPGVCDNLSVSGTVEAFKGPVDLGDRNGNFGARVGVNWGYPLWQEHGIGIQVGTAVTWADFHGTQFTGDDHRVQSFTTVGVFQRHDSGLNWGAVYDYLWDDYYLHMNMHQWRVQAGYEISCEDEIGVWAAIGDNGDQGDIRHTDRDTGEPVIGREHFTPLTQGNLFWRRTWCDGAQTRVWIGWAEEHGELVLGGDFNVPLSDKCAIVGEANFVNSSASHFPAGASEEFWGLSFGVAFYPGCGARRAATSRYAPLLPVANNGTLAVDKLPE